MRPHTFVKLANHFTLYCLSSVRSPEKIVRQSYLSPSHPETLVLGYGSTEEVVSFFRFLSPHTHKHSHEPAPGERGTKEQA